jgi:hypothetical protein
MRIFLRAIDSKALIDKYNSGKYKDIDVEKGSLDFNFSSKSIIHSTDINDPVYAIKHKDVNILCATSNHEYYAFYRKNGKQKDGGRCAWCRRDFQHTPLGIPINHEVDNINDNIIHIFWIEDQLCDFQCLYRYGNLYKNYDNLYNNSMPFIDMMRRLMGYGKIIPAGDPKLIEENGGSIPYSKWKEESHKYKRTGNLILLPLKISYFKE